MRKKIVTLALVILTGFLSACAAPKDIPSDDAITANSYVDGNGKTGITGRTTSNATGEPIEGAYVNIYPDAVSNLLGPSQYLSTPTDKDGNYQVDVYPGTYYVVSRKRVSGAYSGALAPGDLASDHQRVKTTVMEGKLAVVNLPLATVNAPMFFKKTMGEIQTETGIRGRLIDSSGQPIPGSFAIAYENDDIKRLPDYASTLTDQEGEFVVYLPTGGTFYLSGRIQAWDMPRPGELYGVYGNATPAPIEVKEGSFVEGIEIVLTPFSGIYKEGKSKRPY